VNIVVAGYVASFPIAGFFWHSVSYALGFRALGHDVWFVDDSGDEAWGWDLDADQFDPECRAGQRFLEREMKAVGLEGRWVFRHMPSSHHAGMDEETTLAVLADADVFVNVSCTTPIRAEYARIPQRLAIDTDPVFTQIRVAEGEAAAIPATHTRLFTFGRPPLPAQRHEWLPTRQPVALDRWSPSPRPLGAPFTTIAQWRAEYARTWDGTHYGGKDRSFQPYQSLPSRTTVPLSIAFGGRDRRVAAQQLVGHGWDVVDAFPASRSTAAYRSFIAASAGEFSIAKQGYVAPRSGWFSERTCCFLASGRPAVVQDTGFSDWLPTGEGLLAFSTPDEAIAALEDVSADWERHAAAARRLVATNFDAASVCAELLDTL
jgi:hypothetical protein